MLVSNVLLKLFAVYFVLQPIIKVCHEPDSVSMLAKTHTRRLKKERKKTQIVQAMGLYHSLLLDITEFEIQMYKDIHQNLLLLKKRKKSQNLISSESSFLLYQTLSLSFCLWTQSLSLFTDWLLAPACHYTVRFLVEAWWFLKYII